MAISNSVTRLLGIKHPIVLAPMDLVADARLALAVSQAGGFGFIGAGYGDAAWLTRELAHLEQENARRLPFGFGFITWSLARQPFLLDRVLAAKPRAVWLSFGDPEPFVRRVKDAGALLVCQVHDVEQRAGVFHTPHKGLGVAERKPYRTRLRGQNPIEKKRLPREAPRDEAEP